MLYNMETARTVQTAFRFTPEMVRRMKNRARLRGISLNAYIEGLVEEDLGQDKDKYEALFVQLAGITKPDAISAEVDDLFSRHKVELTAEDLEDEKTVWLLSK